MTKNFILDMKKAIVEVGNCRRILQWHETAIREQGKRIREIELKILEMENRLVHICKEKLYEKKTG